MTFWMLLCVSVSLSLAFRVLPAILTKVSFNKHKEFLNFLDYAGCAAIGGMIYIATFNQSQIKDNPIGEISFITINILTLIIAFFLSLRLRKPVFVFIICIFLYAIMLYFYSNQCNS